MLATQAPPAIALITPARRDNPSPPGMTRSASGPRPNTSRVPSGIGVTVPSGLVTCAESCVTLNPGWLRWCAGVLAGSLGSAPGGRIHEFGDGAERPRGVDLRPSQDEALLRLARAVGGRTPARFEPVSRGLGGSATPRGTPRPGRGPRA